MINKKIVGLHSIFAPVKNCKILKMKIKALDNENVWNGQSEMKAIDVCSCVTISGKVSATSTTVASTILR